MDHRSARAAPAASQSSLSPTLSLSPSPTLPFPLPSPSPVWAGGASDPVSFALEAGKLSPYTAIVVFSTGVLASNFLWNSIVMARPVAPPTCTACA